jgi:putative colanic acid biosynthesis acetyltransferase WcaF
MSDWTKPLDASLSRPDLGGPSFSLRHRLFRAIWNVAWMLLAAWTPAPLFGWRRLILLMFGARLAPSARVYGSTRIWFPPNLRLGEHAILGRRVYCYNQAEIHLREGSVVSQDVWLLTGSHDLESEHFQLVTGPIGIGERAWIGAGATVGPGVTVGDHAVLGARAVAFADLQPETVYRGNPAVAVRRRRNLARTMNTA